MEIDREPSEGIAYYNSLLEVPREKVLCIDVETTGLNPAKDEILQLAMVDGNGKELFASLVRPPTRKRWPNAQEVHGITWQMVKDKPDLEDQADIIQGIIDNAELVIGYNLPFDCSMMQAAGFHFYGKRKYDVMEDYAQMFGRWSSAKGGYLWTKLTTAAKHYKIDFGAHDAAEDAKATARLFYAMLSDQKFCEGTVRHDRHEAEKAEEKRLRAESYAAELEKREIEERRKERRTRLNLAILDGVLLAVFVILPLIWLTSCISSIFH